MKNCFRHFYNTTNIDFCNQNFTLVNKKNFLQDGITEFEIFLFSNSYQEKLPIVLANIRV
jgi:hypothetical protein